MNTTAFVLMVLIHAQPVPTLEFSTMAKCKSAIQAINNSEEANHWSILKMTKAFCLRIEK
jgi:hypothetical protein